MNKVKFGLKNVYIAPILQTDENGAPTYGTPFRERGAVSISLDPEGDSNPYYADDIEYYTTISDNGYGGDLELANLSDEFKKQIFGWREDADGNLIEVKNDKVKHFAIAYQFTGDEKNRKVWYYNATAQKPSSEHNSVSDTTEPDPDTMTLSLNSINLSNDEIQIVRAVTYEGQDAYATWFDSVYIPVINNLVAPTGTIDTIAPAGTTADVTVTITDLNTTLTTGTLGAYLPTDLETPVATGAAIAGTTVVALTGLTASTDYILQLIAEYDVGAGSETDTLATDYMNSATLSTFSVGSSKKSKKEEK